MSLLNRTAPVYAETSTTSAPSAAQPRPLLGGRYVSTHSPRPAAEGTYVTSPTARPVSARGSYVTSLTRPAAATSEGRYTDRG